MNIQALTFYLKCNGSNMIQNLSDLNSLSDSLKNNLLVVCMKECMKVNIIHDKDGSFLG